MGRTHGPVFKYSSSLSSRGRIMARFSTDVGASGSKRRRSNYKEEEGDLKKKRARGRSQREALELEEGEESNDVGDEAEGTGEDGGFRGGNMYREFNFRSDPDVLDCSICSKPMRPPIFECSNGHTACSYCCPRLENKCHFCSQPIGHRRSLALEKAIESMVIPCRNARSGCRAVLSSADKAFHEEHCRHAALSCPIRNCTFSSSRRRLFDHAMRVHYGKSTGFSYDQPFVIDLRNQQPCTVLLGEDGHFFVFSNSGHGDFAGNVLSVICLAPNSPECEFWYEIRAESEGGSLRLRAAMEKVRKWNGGGVRPCDNFLVVPDCFSASSTEGQFSVLVCIYKSSVILL